MIEAIWLYVKSFDDGSNEGVQTCRSVARGCIQLCEKLSGSVSAIQNMAMVVFDVFVGGVDVSKMLKFNAPGLLTMDSEAVLPTKLRCNMP